MSSEETKQLSGSENLPEEARLILQEEEALLARVRKTLAREIAHRRHERANINPAQLRARQMELRDLAAGATAYDLPTILQEISVIQAMLDRKEDAPVPDIDTPYFAHLRLDEGGKKTDYCLGRASFVETRMGVRIVDWRYAPIARIFYRYREGEEYDEDLPGRYAEGTVDVRRVVVIYKGELTRVTTPDYALVKNHDGAWVIQSGIGASALGGGTGTATRAGSLGVGQLFTDQSYQADVSALLDKEQFDALNTDPANPLLVLGSAGSGKTTVALHRLAKLTFQEPKRFPAGKMHVVVPEPGLAKLSSRLLEPLGLQSVQVQTLDNWARERYIKAFNEIAPKICEDAPSLCVSLKRHPAFYRQMVKQLPRQGGSKARTLIDVLRTMLTDRKFLQSVVDDAAGTLPSTAIDVTIRHTMDQNAASDIEIANSEGVVSLDGRGVSSAQEEALAGSVDLEDLPILIVMRSLRGAPIAPEHDKAAHMVVDEAEDISLPELDIIGKTIRDKSVTLAGDDAQQTFSSFAGWDVELKTLGAESAARCKLQVSYRCPKPIAALAHYVLGPLAPEEASKAGRDGVPVGRFEFPDAAQTNLFLVDAIQELAFREPNASIGVILRNEESASAFFDLCGEIPRARLVLDGDFSFTPGVDVTDVSSVKGLEFDYVIIPDATAQNYPKTDEARHLLHVAVSRASHQLWVAASGTSSPLLPPRE